MSQTAPKRIQRRRTKGWRMPEGAVYVGRPTLFGNPFSHLPERRPGSRVGGAWGYIAVPTVEDAIACYREFIETRIASLPDLFVSSPDYAKRWAAEFKALRGKDLACWCSLSQPCHADVLLEIANR